MSAYTQKSFRPRVKNGFDSSTLRRPKTAEERERLVRRLNCEISRLGEDRKLGEAIYQFKRIEELGLNPTIVSYTALLNGYVRASEMRKALGVFNSIINSSSSSGKEWYAPKKLIRPNIVTYTTVIKGLCNDGQLAAAWDILKDLIKPLLMMGQNLTNQLTLNVRCINTFLRGCVRVGDVIAAYVLFGCCKSISSVQLMDGNSAAMIVKLLAHAQLTSEALQVMRYFEDKRLTNDEQLDELNDDMKDGVNKDDDNPMSDDSVKAGFKMGEVENDLPVDVFIDLGLAFCLEGKIKKAKKYLEKAKSALAEVGIVNHKFSQHRSREQQREIDRIESFFLINNSSSKSKKGGRETKQPSSQLGLGEFKRLFFFPPVGSRVYVDSLKSISQLSPNSNLTEQDSLIEYLDRSDCPERGSGVLNLGLQICSGPDNNVLMESMNGDKFNFNSIFGNSRNIKLEICSGSGDWVVSQCQQQASSNWVAMELRHDRIFQVCQLYINSRLININLPPHSNSRCQFNYFNFLLFQCFSTISPNFLQIFSTAFMANVQNLCIIGGDANSIIKSNFELKCIQEVGSQTIYINPYSVFQVFINFPEPPPYFDHPNHLLSPAFFRHLHP